MHSPAVRLGWVSWRDQRCPSTPNNVANLAHQSQVFNTAWRQTMCSTNHQVEKLSITVPALPSRKAGGNAAEGSGSPSTSDNIDNLARAPDFQHGLGGTNETPNRLKKLSIKSWGLPSHEARCNATEGLGALQHQTILLIWHGARFSTLSGDKLTDIQRYNYHDAFPFTPVLNLGGWD